MYLKNFFQFARLPYFLLILYSHTHNCNVQEILNLKNFSIKDNKIIIGLLILLIRICGIPEINHIVFIIFLISLSKK